MDNNNAVTKPVTSGTKVEAIGTVKTVVGEVKAVDPGGNERILQAGDKVFPNETIMTAVGALVLIEFMNGTHLDLPSASQIVLDSEVFDPALLGEGSKAGGELTAEQIQEMIARGEDPTAVTEATAAGAGAGDEGGSSFIVVDFNNTQGDVTSGFNTLGIPGPESTTLTELPPVEDEPAPVPPPPNGLPTLEVGSGGVEEDDLGDENALGINEDQSSGANVHVGSFLVNFGSDGPGAITVSLPPGITSQGDAVTLELVSQSPSGFLLHGVTEDERLVFTLEFDLSGGTYTFTLVDNLDHQADDAEDILPLNFSIAVTDSNGDEVSAVLSIDVQDDIPDVEVSNAGEEGEAVLATLTLDESVGGDIGGDGDGVDDDTGVSAPFGRVTTQVYVADSDPEDEVDDAKANAIASLFSIDTAAYGADGEGSLTHAFSLVLSGEDEDGLVETTLSTTNGDTIYLYQEADGSVTGYVGNVVDDETGLPTGAVALTISLSDATDIENVQLTVEQYLPIDHGEDGDDLDAAALLKLVGAGASLDIQYTATIEDADGDEDSSTATSTLANSETSSISIEDDGIEVNPMNTVMRKEVGLSATATLNVLEGADGVSSVKLTIAGLSDGEQIDNLTSGDEPVLYRVSGDGFEGYTLVDGIETVIFTVAPDLAGDGSYSGTYTVSITGALDGAGGEEEFDVGEGIKGGNDTSFFLFAPDVEFDPDDYEASPYVIENNPGTQDDLYGAVDPATGSPNPDSTVIHVYAYNSTDGSELTVNSSDFSLAVGSGQSLSGDDVMVMEFTKASSWVYDDFGGSSEPAGMYSYGATEYRVIQDVQFALFDFSVGETINFELVRHLENGNTEVIGTGTITATSDFSALTGNASLDVKLLQGMEDGDIVDGLQFSFSGFADGEDGETLTGSFDTIQFSVGSGDYKVGTISILEIDEGSDQPFEVTATVTDGDLDVATDTFTISLDGNDGLTGGEGEDVIVAGDTGNTLYGFDGNDILTGGSGADFLIGGAGDDTLSGDGGKDTFVWNQGDAGHDTVLDFNTGEGDVLDVSDLIAGGLELNAVAVDGYLRLELSNTSDVVVQTIDLTTIEVADNTAAQAMLTSLLGSNNIID